MKYVLIVPDGMADEPIAELDGRTPMMVARTPNLDAMVREGMIGRVATIPEGMEPGSDVAALSIMGYDRSRRGPTTAPRSISAPRRRNSGNPMCSQTSTRRGSPKRRW